MAEFPVAIITDEFTQDFEYICETAAQMGIPALEIRTAWNKNIVDMSDSEVGEIGKMAKAAGLEIVPEAARSPLPRPSTNVRCLMEVTSTIALSRTLSMQSTRSTTSHAFSTELSKSPNDWRRKSFACSAFGERRTPLS